MRRVVAGAVVDDRLSERWELLYGQSVVVPLSSTRRDMFVGQSGGPRKTDHRAHLADCKARGFRRGTDTRPAITLSASRDTTAAGYFGIETHSCLIIRNQKIDFDSPTCQTHRHTNHAACYFCSNRPHIHCLHTMRPNSVV